MAHKKGGGSSRNGRDSQSKRLGIKRQDGQIILAGTIIVRQRGTKVLAGSNVGVGRDHTLYALQTGAVVFERTGRDRSRVNVRPLPVIQLGELLGELSAYAIADETEGVVAGAAEAEA